ncbi:rhomboid family intramembrane serine protease [Bifidobacterium pongonis]|uniref:rhomboid family intramembrane serine protease n=1 Tax=Bifidobacterium pongonis TaxID=2834432 RepID=UPI001F39A208|nr:rhomboid family intramembrane serine protease [Bifidobacterium pongonis]
MYFKIPNKREIRYAWNSGGPVITTSIIVICVAVWLVEIITRAFLPSVFAAIVNWGMAAPVVMVQRPWTWLTSMFLHAPSILHVLFNMLTLWCVGPMLERMLGHWRFLALYLISGLGGAAGLMVWARATSDWSLAAYGASGALFGLFAAMLVVFRRVGADIRSMLVWMAVNFAMPFVMTGIAWQAHVGGFIAGGVLTMLLTSGIPALRGRSLTQRMAIYGGAIVVVLIAVIVLCAPRF